MTALAASFPFFTLKIACFLLRHVRTPLPIGFLCIIDKFIIALFIAWDIKLKWGVLPLIIQPSATTPSNLLIYFDIITGISKAPGTFKILMLLQDAKLLFDFEH